MEWRDSEVVSVTILSAAELVLDVVVVPGDTGETEYEAVPVKRRRLNESTSIDGRPDFVSLVGMGGTLSLGSCDVNRSCVFSIVAKVLPNGLPKLRKASDGPAPWTRFAAVFSVTSTSRYSSSALSWRDESLAMAFMLL